MSTTSTPTTRLPARLSLSPAHTLQGISTPSGIGPVDGAWWPRSADLVAEVPALAEAIAATKHALSRLVYEPSGWLPAPRRAPLPGGGQAKLGWFAEGDPHQVSVTLSGGDRLVLAVVPPGTPEREAEWILQQAARPDNVLTSSELVAQAHEASAR